MGRRGPKNSVCGEVERGSSDRGHPEEGWLQALTIMVAPSRERLLLILFTECLQVDFPFLPERQSRVVVRETGGACPFTVGKA